MTRFLALRRNRKAFSDLRLKVIFGGEILIINKHIMKRKELFEPPVVTVIDLRMSGTILQGSVHENVQTEGQLTEDITLTDDWTYEP